MSEYILETEELTKEFAGFVAVNGVNLRVERGTIHALIGPNGAGKTTCFNLLTKFLPPTRGRILLQGPRHHPTGGRRCRAPRPGALVPDLGGVPASHRAGERAHRVAAQARRLVRFLALRERARHLQRPRRCALLADVGLTEFADELAVELPYGRKRALEIATTLALDPEMMLLDEPTAGMGHEDIDRIAELIRRVAADRTVLMVEHNLSVVATCATRITVLTRGQVLAEGDYETCRRTPRCSEAYMGSGMLDVRRAAALRSTNLQAWYGESHILHGVDLDVRQGEVVTLLGRNGAGKTTTLKSIMGIIGKRTGSVALSTAARPIGCSSNQIARARHRASARRSAASSPA